MQTQTCSLVLQILCLQFPKVFFKLYFLKTLLFLGPPLSSLDSNDSEPPQKLQRPDVNLERRESALNAINSNLNAFNNPSSDSADYWVTVFGFSSEDRDMILNMFSRHGNIVSHNIPRIGNWVHLRYSSVLHAQQALKRDGNIISDRLMVGVIKCTDKVCELILFYLTFCLGRCFG